ncbi:YceI family protein [uncultured Jatrophihabitans sp.]|uniref:YceI family protein n=1 Tax=uncultured Jatrophihabitans sp. TaxID=1610747 RepID=UPI0035CB96DD
MTTSTTAVHIPATGTYRVDSAHSAIGFSAKHMFGTGTVTGSFAVTSGDIRVADPVTDSQVSATAAAQSFDSANPKRDAQVKSKSFLHADAHPQILFRSTGITLADDQLILRGEITARGAAAPVDLTVIESRSDAAGLTLRATGKVDRYAHGITKMKGMAGRYLSLDISVSASRV